MKILMLCDFYNHSLQYQENFLSKYYTKQSHEVTIVASTFESIFDYMSNKYDCKVPESENIVDGVKIPLENRLSDFTMYVLHKCGHEPWKEYYAKDKFFEILKKELS